MRKQMTNRSLRDRFGVSANSSSTVSQIIAAAMEKKMIKSAPNAPGSKKFARYIPEWA